MLQPVLFNRSPRLTQASQTRGERFGNGWGSTPYDAYSYGSQWNTLKQAPYNPYPAQVAWGYVTPSLQWGWQQASPTKPDPYDVPSLQQALSPQTAQAIIKDPSVNLSGIEISDPTLIGALKLLAKTKNLAQDERFIQPYGVNILFKNGQEAVNVLRKKGVSVVFDDMSDSGAHAEWVTYRNQVVINKNYRGSTTLPVMLAIAEAIYHEAGHAAKEGDGSSSIQEDLNCLALNAMAYRYHTLKYPWFPYYKAQGKIKPLFDNGVSKYAHLFFNWDPNNPPSYNANDPHLNKLVKRIADKYGDLPPSSPDHPIPKVPLPYQPITKRVVHELLRRGQ